MSEAILKFKLPEENEDFRHALDGGKWKSALWELDQRLRSKLKYEEHDEPEASVYREVRDWIRDILGEDGLSL